MNPSESTLGFLPIYDNHTKILILGSAPSVRSLQKQEYYGNHGNHFWKIICENLKVPDPIDYQKRIKLLKDAQIGLWDVYQTFERKGSLDSNFSTVMPNDFTQILQEAPIQLILANGKLAYQEAMKNPTLVNVPILLLPSTSGANNRMIDERASAWAAALSSLKRSGESS